MLSPENIFKIFQLYLMLLPLTAFANKIQKENTYISNPWGLLQNNSCPVVKFKAKVSGKHQQSSAFPGFRLQASNFTKKTPS